MTRQPRRAANALDARAARALAIVAALALATVCASTTATATATAAAAAPTSTSIPTSPDSAGPARSEAGGRTVVVDRVEWILADTDKPPAADAGWRTDPLPLRWRKPDDRPLARAWFRLRFDLPADKDARLAAYLPKMGNGGRVWLNGVPIGDVQTMDADVQVRWFRPFLFAFNAYLLQPEGNELVIRQQTRDERNVFRGVAIGPFDALQDRYEWMLFWQHTTATLAAWFCLFVGLFLIVLWGRRRDETLSALFGVACLMWALRSMSFVVEVIPAQLWFGWRALYYVATGGFIASMSIGLVRFAGGSLRVLVPLAIAYWAFGPLTFLALGWTSREFLDQVWTPGFLPFIAYAAAALARAWWRERSGAQLTLLLAVVAATAMALHDYLIGLDPRLLPGSTFFGMHLAAPIVLASLGAHLLDRFVRSLEASESLARGLEQRVTERERELAANFVRLRALERDRALADERQRIMRELHDGVGSQLLSSLAMVERGAADRDDVVRALRECLDDMRLAIDTLAPESADLVGALGNLRYRFAPRFEALGVASRWNVSTLPDPLPLSPHHSLQLLRIVQESFANVLKHAQARTVTVEAVVEDGTLVLQVSDDGVGIVETPNGSGRGLRNMQRRAAEAGATLRVEVAPGGGTRVRVERPLWPGLANAATDADEADGAEATRAVRSAQSGQAAPTTQAEQAAQAAQTTQAAQAPRSPPRPAAYQGDAP
jgi:signal transduction histidine kinase